MVFESKKKIFDAFLNFSTLFTGTFKLHLSFMAIIFNEKEKKKLINYYKHYIKYLFCFPLSSTTNGNHTLCKRRRS